MLAVLPAGQDAEGWATPPEERKLTLYASHDGGALTVNEVEAVKLDGKLVRARTHKGEVFVLAVEDVFAASLDGPVVSGRKAGFGSK